MHALESLSAVEENDMVYMQMLRDLMQDLTREVSLSVDNLSEGRIPPYLALLELVKKTFLKALLQPFYNSHKSTWHTAWREQFQFLLIQINLKLGSC